MSTGFVALARTTFDVPFALEVARSAFEALSNTPGIDLAGSPELRTDTDQVQGAVRSLSADGVEALVVLQATFADSTLVATVAEESDVPLVLWATRENRSGGRLRLNSFCGINLAAYYLARNGSDYRWVYQDVDDPGAPDEIREALGAPAPPRPRQVSPPDNEETGLTLAGRTVGLVGDRPDGFEPCDYKLDDLQSMFGLSVDPIPISSWFEDAGSVSEERVTEVTSHLGSTMIGLDEVDQESLGRSIRLYLGLSDLVEARGWSGVATRCWPECFTEFGGAACAGNSLLTSSGTPGCCEADVYGNVTALLLQEVAGTSAMVADLIDLDRDSNTSVFWHCGLAPADMAPDDTLPRATVHSNRRQPLLNEFPLRAGRITIARVSQSRHEVKLVVGGGEMLDAPLPFSGTSGVAKLDTPVGDVLNTIMGEGLEHHYGLVYGDHRRSLHDYAASIGIPVIEL